MYYIIHDVARTEVCIEQLARITLRLATRPNLIQQARRLGVVDSSTEGGGSIPSEFEYLVLFGGVTDFSIQRRASTVDGAAGRSEGRCAGHGGRQEDGAEELHGPVGTISCLFRNKICCG